MGKSVNQSVVASSAQTARPILAADVVGTHARIALVANAVTLHFRARVAAGP